MKGLKVLGSAILILYSLTSLSWARITVAPEFTGTLILTLADGDVTLYESGDALPEIPSGSTLEVFDGSIAIQTEAGDTLQVGCFGDEHSVGGGSSADLTCGATSGMLKIDGKEYPISGAQQPLPGPTAESDPTGVPTDQDPVPDSRSIQASTVI